MTADQIIAVVERHFDHDHPDGQRLMAFARDLLKAAAAANLAAARAEGRREGLERAAVMLAAKQAQATFNPYWGAAAEMVLALINKESA